MNRLTFSPDAPFALNDAGAIPFFYAPLLEQTGLVTTAFSTRLGGVSEGVFSQSNYSFSRGDDVQAVRENYRLLFQSAGLAPESVCLSRQVHETHVLCAEDYPQMRGIYDAPGSPEADGLITAQPGFTLVKLSADCATIFLLDPKTPAIALLHSGWRGTLENMASAGLSALETRYGSRPEDCLAAIAPAIGLCCFEVGEDVAAQFEARYGAKHIDSSTYAKPHIDITGLIEDQLLAAGVQQENIAASRLCTYCNSDLFFSHRRDRGQCGLTAAVFALKGLSQ